MKAPRGLLAIGIAIAASRAATASIELGCVQVDVDQNGAVCLGGLAPLDVTIANACTGDKHVAVTFSVDREPLRSQASSIVRGQEQLRKTVMVEIPSTVPPGTHALTMTARDIEGNSNTTSASVIVRNCFGLAQ